MDSSYFLIAVVVVLLSSLIFYQVGKNSADNSTTESTTTVNTPILDVNSLYFSKDYQLCGMSATVTNSGCDGCFRIAFSKRINGIEELIESIEGVSLAYSAGSGYEWNFKLVSFYTNLSTVDNVITAIEKHLCN